MEGLVLRHNFLKEKVGYISTYLTFLQFSVLQSCWIMVQFSNAEAPTLIWIYFQKGSTVYISQNYYISKIIVSLGIWLGKTLPIVLSISWNNLVHTASVTKIRVLSGGLIMISSYYTHNTWNLSPTFLWMKRNFAFLKF